MATPHFSTTGMEDLFNSAHMFRCAAVLTCHHMLPAASLDGRHGCGVACGPTDRTCVRCIQIYIYTHIHIHTYSPFPVPSGSVRGGSGAEAGAGPRRYTRNYSLPLHGAPYNAQSNKWGMEALAYRAAYHSTP